MDNINWKGYRRKNGSTGIRNNILVLYTVNCSAFVAYKAGADARERKIPAQVAGNGSCFDNQIVINRMLRLIAHGNVGAVLIVGHGCEFIQAQPLEEFARKQGKPVKVVMTQKLGTQKSIEACSAALDELWEQIRYAERENMPLSALTIGITTTAEKQYENAAGILLGVVSDRMLADGATVLMDGLDGGELRRKEILLRAQRQEEMQETLDKLEGFHALNGPIRSKSAYFSTGTAMICGTLKVTQTPEHAGLWFVDSLPDKNFENGFAAASAASRAMDLICSGAQVVLLGLGNGAVVGTAVAPVIGICATPEISSCFPDEIDCCAGEAGSDEPYVTLLRVVNGAQTVSERLGIFGGTLRALA